VIAAILVAGVALAGVVAHVVRTPRVMPTTVITGPAPPAPLDARAAPPAAAHATPTISYVGSGRCAECHEKQARAWRTSWHARALAPATPAAVAGNFGNAHFTGSSSEAWMTRKGETSVMRAPGADGALADFRVDWVIGGKRMQDNITVRPDGRWQVLPVYFHVTQHAWVDYTETKQGALTPEHPFYWTNVRRMANHECLDCHTTDLHVAYDEAARQWTTSFRDGSVACESCHGPGSRHAETQEAADILQPAHAGAAGLTACARCHGPHDPVFPLFDAEHAFRAGDPYDERYDPIEIGASGDFFADGRPSTSSFEYQAVVQSACYRTGGATCLTCHTAPHDAHRPAELRADPDASCRTCHAPIAKAGRGHSHHAAVRCVACHMPPVVTGVLDHFADHAIDVPSPANTVRHGVPSACGVCHADRTPDALAAWLVTQWPAAATRQARRIRLADAFDDATRQDSARPLQAVIGDAGEAPTLRGAAALAIARRFGAAAAPTLRPLLDSPEVLLRAKGLEALGLAHATSAAEAIAARLDDRSIRVQLAAALALYDLHDPRGEPALARLASAPATAGLMVPHLELGTAAARRGDLAGARSELTEVVRLAPYYVEALARLAAIAAQQGALVEARARNAQALALDPHHKGALGLAAKLASDPR
jgi:Cytochrome c3/Doubled CXXCH motif (Paired_CXXCH_1)/Cytochrome c554 and c-prime